MPQDEKIEVGAPCNAYIEGEDRKRCKVYLGHQRGCYSRETTAIYLLDHFAMKNDKSRRRQLEDKDRTL